MGPPNTGPTMGRRHALRWGQAEGEGNRNLLYFSLSYLVDLCLSTISAEPLRHTETLYENLNLSRYLCWEKSAAFPPQAQVDLGTSYRYTQLGLCEVMSYFAPFKSCAHHMLWVKRRQVVLGLKWSLFMCSLPSSCPFPKLGALFTLLPLTWALYDTSQGNILALYGELMSSNGHLAQQRCVGKKTCVNVKHVCACPEDEASDS